MNEMYFDDGGMDDLYIHEVVVKRKSKRNNPLVIMQK